MDVEITKKNGKTFRLSEYDIQAQDFNVSSIELLPTYGSIEGRSGTVDYGADYGSRTISVPFYLHAYDMHDYPLLRDELFSLVATKESFYIRELRRPSEFTTCDDGYDDRYVGGKRYLVRLSNVIDLDQQRTYGFGEMVFETTELPFAESIGTSADIDGANLIPYADLSNANNYSQWTAIGDTSFTSSSPVKYEGYNKEFLRVSVPSAEVGSNRRVRTGYNIKLINGRNYELSFIAVSSDWLDTDFNYTGILTLSGSFAQRVNLNRTKVGDVDVDGFIKPVYKYYADYTHNSESGDSYSLMIGTKQTNESGAYFLLAEPSIRPLGGINSNDELWGFGMGLIADDDSLIYTHTGTEFKIFNPGIEVHPFEQDLVIEISDVVGSTSYLQLENLTTGDVFRVTEAVNGNQLIKLDGPNITSNGLQYLRKTNRKYITLAPGWNNFRITGATSAKVSFDTRFYYL